ncbi:beta strand repeat-containing protein, partial [Aurantiacibacter gilvus]
MNEELNEFGGELSGDESVTDVAAGGKPSQGSKQATTQVMAPDAGNTVVLPAGQTIESLDFDGRDLVIILADGTRIVVPDGAIVVPQLVVDGVPIPPANVAALLTGNEPEPADGLTPSSGGNFATDPGEIQSAYDLGDLLPYTELPQNEQPEEEIIPDLIDNEPDVVIVTPDNPGGDEDNPVGVENAIALVREDGLPERGDEPEGTDAASDGETTSGTIIFIAEDGLSAILINGVEVTTVGQEFVSPFGTLTITSIDLGTGEIGFSYTLADNTLGIEADGFFEATVVDTDGDVATASLQVILVDDSPIAADDIGIVPAGTHAPIEGNVLDNDVSGADDFPVDGGVTGFSNQGGSAEPGTALQGEYGVLTLNSDGSYTYVRDVNTPGGVEESFDYSVVDQDGSTSSATLLIQVGDADDTIIAPQIGEGTIVDEGGLPPRTDEPAGTGEIADNDAENDSDTSETTSATVIFNSPDGVADLSVNDVSIDQGNLPQTVISDDTGVLVITEVTYDPVTGDGTITYEYTLVDNTAGDDTSVSFELSVTDLDGDTASDTLTITIVDDEPSANADADSVTEDGPLVASGSVMTAVDPAPGDANASDGVADLEGADGAQVTGVAFGSAPGDVVGNVGTGVAGTYGSLSIAANGDYVYTLDNTNAAVQGLDGTESLSEVFTYTITDGDGDTSTTTVTITINGADDGVTINGLDGAGAEETLYEDDLADGSSPDAPALTQTGTFTVDSPDGLATLAVGGVTVFDASASTTYPVTIDDPVYGLLTITGVTPTFDIAGDVVAAVVSYSYTLQDNSVLHTGADDASFTDSFDVVATDTDGSSNTASLDITIVDDIPVADDDANSVTEGLGNTATGNVYDGVGASAGDDADTIGADVPAGGTEVTGAYFGVEADLGTATVTAVAGATVINGT